MTHKTPVCVIIYYTAHFCSWYNINSDWLIVGHYSSSKIKFQLAQGRPVGFFEHDQDIELRHTVEQLVARFEPLTSGFWNLTLVPYGHTISSSPSILDELN